LWWVIILSSLTISKPNSQAKMRKRKQNWSRVDKYDVTVWFQLIQLTLCAEDVRHWWKFHWSSWRITSLLPGRVPKGGYKSFTDTANLGWMRSEAQQISLEPSGCVSCVMTSDFEQCCRQSNLCFGSTQYKRKTAICQIGSCNNLKYQCWPFGLDI
jgi:hypothetical protein